MFTILFCLKGSTTVYVVVVDRFYIIIALFSALDQTHSALACSSKWVTVAFFKVRFEYPPKWCTFSTVWLLTWLVPRETVAVSARSVYIIEPRTMSYSQNYIYNNLCYNHAVGTVGLIGPESIYTINSLVIIMHSLLG